MAAIRRLHPLIAFLTVLIGVALVLTSSFSTDSARDAVPATLAGLLLLGFGGRLLLSGRIRPAELRAVFNHSPAPELLVDPNGIILDANDAFLALAYIDASSAVEVPVADYIGADAWDTLKSLQNTRVSGRPRYLDCPLIRPGNGRIAAGACLLRVSPSTWLLRFENRSGLDNDAVRRHTLENRFISLFDQPGLLYFVLDQDGLIVEFNEAVRTRLGSDVLTRIGQPMTDLMGRADRRGFVRLRRTITEAQRPWGILEQCTLRQADIEAIVEVCMTRFPLEGSSAEGVLLRCREIGDQLQSMKQLELSEARFSRIFHTSPDAILILRQKDGVVLDFNAGFTELFGYTREDAIGLPEDALNMWQDPLERDAVFSSLQGRRAGIEADARLQTRSGLPIRAEITLRYIEIDGSIGILLLARNITKRVEAELALKDSEEKFSKVFSKSPDGIMLMSGLTGSIYDVNDAFVAISGYAREELIGKRFSELSVFAHPHQLNDVYTIIADEREFQNLELSLLTRARETIPTLMSGAMFDWKGEPCVLCITKDIRDQRRAEENLRASEERFRGAFENAPIGMLLVDYAGQITQANHYVARLLSYKQADMTGLHISRLVPPEERVTLKEMLSQLDGNGDFSEKSELRMMCQNGMEIWANVHIVLQYTAHQNQASYMLQIADVTEMKVNRQRMEQMAFYDTLTNLANRRLFNERLVHAIDHAKRHAGHSALLYLDLDQFKRVNDTLGHEIGDQLLRQVAGRLQTCVRKEDTVARPGGDEFTVLLFDVVSSADAGAVAEKILRKLREPITISGHTLIITTSIGITVIPGDGTDPGVLTKNADLAMYKAKERGRNNYQYFSEEMNTNALMRLRTEYELRRALERHELELFYQPKVRISDQNIEGVESLIRWNHPERGLLAPDKFISIAEETGAILDIGSWVIEQSCVAGRILTEQTGRNMQVAINISPTQFRDPLLVANIRRCLRDTQLLPQQLELEITETMLMHDVEAAAATLEQLQELGVSLAIDDFGTGYSSLNYLKKFPIDTVKVDRSFIMDIPSNADDMAITAAVVAMAHQLNMRVVAEGVETQAQLEFLAELRCEFAQGYLFSKPVPLNELRGLLAPSDQKVAEFRET